jgi:threonine synthase
VEVNRLPSLTCVRCGAAGEPSEAERYLGCPRCRIEGVQSNYRWDADLERVAEAVGRPSARRGMWRFAGALPVDDAVTLGEGDTPLTRVDTLAATYGVTNLYAKNESVNPTWSHKDRLAAVTVAAASRAGSRVVTVASTGNHGAAIAAYAARAGLRCVIATLASVPPPMKDLMAGYGAEVVATETSEERYELVTAGVERHGWYPASNITSPPVGSDPYGIAGYKTIAYELFEQLGGAPDWMVIPVAYGDCLAGVVQGFAELNAVGLIRRMPRIVGAELFGALEGALAGAGLGPVRTHATAAFSIGGSFATYQAIAALQTCHGTARSAAEHEIAEAQIALGITEGLYAEAAAAVPFAVVRTLAAEGAFQPDDRIVCLLTSSGLKDSRGAEARPVDTIPPDLEAFKESLRSAGRLDPAAEADLFGNRAIRPRARTSVTSD